MVKIFSKDQKLNLIISALILLVLTSCTAVKKTPLQSVVSPDDWKQFQKKPMGVFVIVPDKRFQVVRTDISPPPLSIYGGKQYFEQYRNFVPFSPEWDPGIILSNGIVSLLKEKYGLTTVLLKDTNSGIFVEITDKSEAIHNKFFEETFEKYLQSELHKSRKYAVMGRTPRELHLYYDELSGTIDAQYRSLLNRLNGMDYVVEVTIAVLAIHMNFHQAENPGIFGYGRVAPHLYLESYLDGLFYARVIKISDGSVIWRNWVRTGTQWEKTKEVGQRTYTWGETISLGEYDKHGWQYYLSRTLKDINKEYSYVIKQLLVDPSHIVLF